MGHGFLVLVLPSMNHFMRQRCQDSASRAEARIDANTNPATIKRIAKPDSLVLVTRADFEHARMKLRIEHLLIDSSPPMPKHMDGWHHREVGLLCDVLGYGQSRSNLIRSFILRVVRPGRTCPFALFHFGNSAAAP